MKKLFPVFLLLICTSFAGTVSQAPAARIATGSGVPSNGLCVASGDVGKVYINKTAGAANSSFYSCAKTGASSYSWELLSNGSGIVSASSGSGNPNTGGVTCTAADATHMTFYINTAASPHTIWWCPVTNTWRQILDTDGSGTLQITGTTGTAPSTPTTGNAIIYSDSTQKGLSVKDDLGQVTRTVKPTDCGANFAQKINADGTVTCAAAGGGGGGTSFVDYQPTTGSIVLPLLTETTMFTTTIPGGTLTPGHCLVGSVAFQHTSGSLNTGFYMWVGGVQKHITDTTSNSTYQMLFEVCEYTDTAHQQWNVPAIVWSSGSAGIDLSTSPVSYGIWAPLTFDSTIDQVIKFTAYEDTTGGDPVVGLSWRIALQ